VTVGATLVALGSWSTKVRATTRVALRLTHLEHNPIFHLVADSSIANLPIVTLTTDFGLDDWYVAAMKAVLLSQCPPAQLIDVTHTIPAGDLVKGSITLERAIASCQSGTVHLAVIDPGVGSARRGLITRLNQQLVVCPDNGLITWAMRRMGKGEFFQITWQPAKPSATFHGRDIFAPVAGMLAAGRAAGDLGRPINDPVMLPLAISPGPGGEIIHIDQFGNATTNIPGSAIGRNTSVRIGNLTLPFSRTYSDVPAGQPVALIGSSELLEIAVRDASAAAKLSLFAGAAVFIE